MTFLVTVGMWTHMYLTIAVVMNGAGSANPIRNELRGAAAAIPVVALWALVQRSI